MVCHCTVLVLLIMKNFIPSTDLGQCQISHIMHASWWGCSLILLWTGPDWQWVSCFVDQIYNVAKVEIIHPSTHPSIHPSEDLAKSGYKLDMKVF